MRQTYYSKSFEETTVLEEPAVAEPLPGQHEVNYEFEGFKIEVNEKIVLMPVQLKKPHG